MRCQGGKARIAKHVASVVNATPGRAYRLLWEPFAGGLNVTPHLSAGGPTIASDVHPGLVALYTYAARHALPTEVSEEEYIAAKDLPAHDPLRAFIRIGCSFGGASDGGFARGLNYGRSRNYAAQSARAITRDARACADNGVIFARVDFCRVRPEAFGWILYLDPPYRGTRDYGRAFDYDAFVDRALAWAEGNTVYVSEYDFPHGRVVWERSKHVGLRSGKNAQAQPYRTERIYAL